jgi:precorrin-6A synthase
VPDFHRLPLAFRREYRFVSATQFSSLGESPPSAGAGYGKMPPMRKLFVIGIGAGDPEQVTIQAIRAMNAVDVFFVLDKGPAAADLVQLRKDILQRYATERPYRVVELADPPRDRSGQAYVQSVEAWHTHRADAYAQAIRDELARHQCGAFLVWGDPALYDSTLRILDQVLASGAVEFDYEVIPGVTSIQTLAAKHRLLLNGIGEGILITTGRRLAQDWTRGIDNVLVMLDGACAFSQLDPAGVEIFWGAYLGTKDEITLAGQLSQVGERIVAARAAARAEKGWIMDTYLLRRTTASPTED